MSQGFSSDQRAGAVLSEEFEQEHVRNSSVKNDSSFHAAFHRFDRRLDLRDHATRDRPVGNQRARFEYGELRNQLVLPVEHAFDIG